MNTKSDSQISSDIQNTKGDVVIRRSKCKGRPTMSQNTFYLGKRTIERESTLYLDLDKTLVFAYSMNDHMSPDMRKKAAHADFSVQFPIAHGAHERYVVFLRPGLHKFLAFAAERFELVLFTAASRVYANAIVDALESQRKYFSHRLYREHCTSAVQSTGEVGFPVKYLSSVADRINTRSYLVDDNPIQTQANPGKSILVKPFEGEAKAGDAELSWLQAALEALECKF